MAQSAKVKKLAVIYSLREAIKCSSVKVIILLLLSIINQLNFNNRYVQDLYVGFATFHSFCIHSKSLERIPPRIQGSCCFSVHHGNVSTGPTVTTHAGFFFTD